MKNYYVIMFYLLGILCVTIHYDYDEFIIFITN